MKAKGLTTLAALCIGTLASGGDIYTGNCDATNAAVTSKLKCYNCCNDQNGNSVDTANCQESCDAVFRTAVGGYFSPAFAKELFASRGDWRAQMSFMTDKQLWDWFTAGDRVNDLVVEMVEWLYLNAADVVVTRHAIVLLSSLHFEHKLTAEGQELAEAIFEDALASEDFRIRRAALYSFQDTQVFLTNPAILMEMIRVTAQDPDQSVRDVGFQILADR